MREQELRSRDVLSGSRRDLVNGESKQDLNRIEEVIQREEISARSLAKRMNMTKAQLRELVQPDNDLRLSELYRLRDVLRVPTCELLVGIEEGLSEPLRLRSQLLRLMRTVYSIQESTSQDSIQKLALQMAEQLVGIMPELKHVSAWPSVGQRRGRDELGAITDRCVSAELFSNSMIDE